MLTLLKASAAGGLSAEQMWESVGAATRLNYMRSLKKWLIFCADEDIRVVDNNTTKLQKFIGQLSQSLGA